MTLSRAFPSIPVLLRSGFALRAEHGLAIGKLQIFGDDAQARFRRIAGVDAPAAGRQAIHQETTFAWLAPGEWLLTGQDAQVATWLARFDEHGADDVLAVDLSQARVALVVEGAEARDTLASHSPLDLWAEAFPVDAVARTALADTGMFIARLGDLADGPRFRIIVDQTMAAYVVRMLASLPSRSGTST